jgi:hypothetical protein
VNLGSARVRLVVSKQEHSPPPASFICIVPGNSRPFHSASYMVSVRHPTLCLHFTNPALGCIPSHCVSRVQLVCGCMKCAQSPFGEQRERDPTFHSAAIPPPYLSFPPLPLSRNRINYSVLPCLQSVLHVCISSAFLACIVRCTWRCRCGLRMHNGEIALAIQI